MNPKKLSRRDAIKLLSAVTGATVLANLPSKWSTPQIAHGVLPAHAQTSNTLLTFIDGGFIRAETSFPQVAQVGVQEVSAQRGVGMCVFVGSHWVQISQPVANIPLVLACTSSSPLNWFSPAGGPNGVYYTDVDGKVFINIYVGYNSSLNFEWSFQNSSHGVDIRTFNRPCNPI